MQLEFPHSDRFTGKQLALLFLPGFNRVFTGPWNLLTVFNGLHVVLHRERSFSDEFELFVRRCGLNGRDEGTGERLSNRFKGFQQKVNR